MAASSHLAGRDQRAACPDQPPVLPITLIQVCVRVCVKGLGGCPSPSFRLGGGRCERVWVLSNTLIQAWEDVRCMAWAARERKQ